MHAQVDKRSSTSSFDRRVFKDIGATVVVAVVVLVAAELAFRSVASDLSRNSQTIEAHIDRAQRIRGEHERPSVLILGNSTSGNAIDAALLSEELQARGADVLIEHQPADSTAMRDWYLELKNLFVAHGAVPDYVVLPVGDPRDLTRVNPRTEDLVHFFLADEDLDTIFTLDDINSFEERTGIHLARLSSLYCFRGRIQKRTLVEFVPGYAELRIAMNTGGRSRGTGEALITPAWADLMRDLTEQYDIQPVIVALPTRDLGGRFLSEDRQLAELAGWPVLEPGADAVWSDEDVPDGLHLSRPAQLRFTTMLAGPLAAVLHPAVATSETAERDSATASAEAEPLAAAAVEGRAERSRDRDGEDERERRSDIIAEALPRPDDTVGATNATALGAGELAPITDEPNVGALHTEPSLGAPPASLLRQ